MVNLGWPWLEHEERRADNGREKESIFGLHERQVFVWSIITEFECEKNVKFSSLSNWVMHKLKRRVCDFLFI